MPERAFQVDIDPDDGLRAVIAEAQSEGKLPPVRAGGSLLGASEGDDLAFVDVSEDQLRQLATSRRLPRWVAAKNPLSGGYVETRALMRDKELVTVCEEAACPNIGQCWGRGTATFMIGGSHCTRGCGFCNVITARPLGPPDPDEPRRIAEAAASMGLSFVVITAVARDDLPDGGAEHFAATVAALRERLPETRVELLVPDFRGSWDALDTVVAAAPDVLNHNTETVPRLYSTVRPGARYERTLELLARSRASGLRTKSGVMVGLGESLDEIRAVFADLAAVGCDLVTVGQYLRPTAHHLPVARYYAPAEYPALAEIGRECGLAHVEAGPLVRSSFEADRVADAVGGPFAGAAEAPQVA